MSGGTFVPRNECPGGHFFQGDSHSSDTGSCNIRTPYGHRENDTNYHFQHVDNLALVFEALLLGSAFIKLMFTVWIVIHLFALAVFHKNLQRLKPLYVVSSLLVSMVVTATLLGENLRSGYPCEREDIVYSIIFAVLVLTSLLIVVMHGNHPLSSFLNMTSNIRRRCVRCYLFSCTQYCFSFLRYQYLSMLCSIS